MDQLELKMKPPCERPLSRTPSQTSQETNYKTTFSFFTSLSTAEANGFGVKFIGLYATVGFIAILDSGLYQLYIITKSMRGL